MPTASSGTFSNPVHAFPSRRPCARLPKSGDSNASRPADVPPPHRFRRSRLTRVRARVDDRRHTARDVLEARRGVCQDFAHVALALARAHGIPCRYVSGYLAPEMSSARPADSASHAWIEAWLPGLEWTAFDPTHDLVPANVTFPWRWAVITGMPPRHTGYFAAGRRGRCRCRCGSRKALAACRLVRCCFRRRRQ